jgi:acetolactate synthase small subunit
MKAAGAIPHLRNWTMRKISLKGLVLVAALICIFCEVRAQSGEDLVARIYDYTLPRQTLTNAVRVGQLMDPHLSQSRLERIEVQTAIHFLMDKVELVEAQRREIKAPEEEVEAQLQKVLDSLKKVATDESMKVTRNLALAEARSFEEYNALPDKSESEARKIYDKYATQFKKYSTIDVTFERWMISVISYARNVDQFRALISSSVEDAVRQGAPSIRASIIKSKLEDLITSNVASAELHAGTREARRDAAYQNWLAREVFTHAVFYDKELDGKVRARLQEIISTSAAVAQENAP